DGAVINARDGSVLNGGLLNNSGTGWFTLADSAVSGTVQSDGGALLADVQRSVLSGDVVELNNGVVSLALSDNSTGAGGWQGGTLNLDSTSGWTFDKDSLLTALRNNGVVNFTGGANKTLTLGELSGSGEFHLNTDLGANQSDTLTVTGSATGSHTLTNTNTGSVPDGSAAPLLLASAPNGDAMFSGELSAGLYKYPVQNGADIGLGAGSVHSSVAVIKHSMWFAQQNSLVKRMGDLRLTGEARRSLKNSWVDNVWLRSHGQQLNVGASVTGASFKQFVYGMDFGADHRWQLDNDNALFAGVFAGYGRSDLDYRIADTHGEMDSYHGGLYASWLNRGGWYADVTLKVANIAHDLDADNLRSKFDDFNIGGSVELGRRFTFSDAWFIEPQLQINYLHNLAENYNLGPMRIHTDDLDAFQFRVGAQFGRVIKLANGGLLQPYLKVNGVEMISTGGRIGTGNQSLRARMDGARADMGAGVIWQVDADNQLHLDYEASFGDKYDKPWGLTLGYRRQF
ncbi:MAG: autotransporter outer membrane beta-barrel domain-containing protein, partial [Verrucomicrobiales bacterium]|nr:autotransporter outer membrane beta-barrel domain-containing protein [Verrucomicrobiales bacterium]